MEAHRVGLPIAVGIAVVAAGAATFALRPRNGLIKPAPVAADRLLQRIRARPGARLPRSQTLLGLGGLAIESATLAVLAFRPPGGCGARWSAGGAADPRRGGARSGLLGRDRVVGCRCRWSPSSAPATSASPRRTGALDRGPAQVGRHLDGRDRVGGAALLMGLIRRFPRSWFALGAVRVVAFSAVFVFFAPVLIDPLFNKFEALLAGVAVQHGGARRSRDRARVDVGQVYKVDASRRDDRRERLRERDRPHEAGGALRHPAAATSRRRRCARSSRTSWAT